MTLGKSSSPANARRLPPPVAQSSTHTTTEFGGGFGTDIKDMAADTMDGLVPFAQFGSEPSINLPNASSNLLLPGNQLQGRADGRPVSSSTGHGAHNRTHSQSEPGGRRGKKRKLSQATNRRQSQTSPDDGHEEQDDGSGSANAGSPPRKQRACDQCKQQKLKCNLIEDPYKPCDRCKKFGHECKITDDFKRIAKRTQLADLEKQNEMLNRQVAELNSRLADASRGGISVYHGLPLNENEGSTYPSLLPSAQSGGGAPSPAVMSAGIPNEHTEQAHLLLQLKQGQMVAQQMRQGQEAPRFKRLGDFTLSTEFEEICWKNFFATYHKFLPILDEERNHINLLFERGQFLFWTIMLISLRHMNDELESENFFMQLLPFYQDLLKDTITKPPKNHFTIKALCLLCYWPLPVTSTTEDMTLTYSGIMMKHAMQIGLHRPSHPDDFARTRVQLRPEDINDRLRTWVCCNIVAQNVSTGYGQPPDTLYDATLNKPFHAGGQNNMGVSSNLHARLEIEKISDQITRSIYIPKNHVKSHLKDAPIWTQVDMILQNLKNLEATIDISSPLDLLYYHAVHLHLRLHVFFAEPHSQRYQSDLNELYMAASAFLDAAVNCGYPLTHCPNYITQMMFAAAVALLKLLNSSFASYVNDRETGEKRFWDAIQAIREMSVRSNDLPQRLAEVFAQMWKADAERFEGPGFVADPSSNGKAENGETATVADLKLNSKSRMSMSHVYDSIWRWREEIDGKVRAEKLETAIKNPTSPQASTHRGSFGSGRRPSDTVFLDAQLTNVPGVIPFEGFGEFELFDPLSWALDMTPFTDPTPPPAMGWS